MDFLISLLLKEEINKLRTNWTFIHYLNYFRLLFSRWRGETWIKKLWSNTKITFDEMQYTNQQVNWCYVAFNTQTKRIYIGQTSRTLIKRQQDHYYSIGNLEDR